MTEEALSDFYKTVYTFGVHVLSDVLFVDQL